MHLEVTCEHPKSATIFLPHRGGLKRLDWQMETPDSFPSQEWAPTILCAAGEDATDIAKSSHTAIAGPRAEQAYNPRARSE
jgi:hypothetical protein